MDVQRKDGSSSQFPFLRALCAQGTLPLPESSVLYPKDSSTIRIFVLGSSAANGDPEPAYGFCRQLEILLNEHSERKSFEVINAAVTAMNSFVARRIAQDCVCISPIFLLCIWAIMKSLGLTVRLPCHWHSIRAGDSSTPVSRPRRTFDWGSS